jgi:hypothetical protein
MTLKQLFADTNVTVSDVDIVELHKHINKQDAQTIADIVHDALVDMGIEHEWFAWDIQVTVEQNNETTL